MEVSFPDYEINSSALVKIYLGRKFGLCYAEDQFAGYKEWAEHYHASGIAIADRYTTNNAVHQCSNVYLSNLLCKFLGIEAT